MTTAASSGARHGASATVESLQTQASVEPPNARMPTRTVGSGSFRRARDPAGRPFRGRFPGSLSMHSTVAGPPIAIATRRAARSINSPGSSSPAVIRGAGSRRDGSSLTGGWASDGDRRCERRIKACVRDLLPGDAHPAPRPGSGRVACRGRSSEATDNELDSQREFRGTCRAGHQRPRAGYSLVWLIRAHGVDARAQRLESSSRGAVSQSVGIGERRRRSTPDSKTSQPLEYPSPSLTRRRPPLSPFRRSGPRRCSTTGGSTPRSSGARSRRSPVTRRSAHIGRTSRTSQEAPASSTNVR